MPNRHVPAAERRLDSLSDLLRILIGAELERDERIHWIEQPIVGRLAFHHSGLMCLLGVACILMISFWMLAMVLNNGASPWWGLPFLLLGLALTSSPWWAVRRARHTAYLITDRRALACHAAYPVAVYSYRPDFSGAIRRWQRPDGSGDLALGAGADFLALRDVREAERMLRETLLRPPSST